MAHGIYPFRCDLICRFQVLTSSFMIITSCTFIHYTIEMSPIVSPHAHKKVIKACQRITSSLQSLYKISPLLYFHFEWNHACTHENISTFIQAREEENIETHFSLHLLRTCWLKLNVLQPTTLCQWSSKKLHVWQITKFHI